MYRQLLTQTWYFFSRTKQTAAFYTGMSSDYSVDNEYGYGNNDRLALFTNIFEEFQAYLLIYIALQTSDWILIIKNYGNKIYWV